MLRNLGIFVIGVVAGVFALMIFSSPPEQQQAERSPDHDKVNPTPEFQSGTIERDPSYEELRETISALEGQIRTLKSAQLNRRADLDQAATVLVPDSENLAQRLVSEGLTQERAEWVKHRYDLLSAEVMELTWDVNFNLREEIGDLDFERFLRASGQETEVQVQAVVENSPAALAGLRPGDEIVSYDGNRVFDPRELFKFTSKEVSSGVVVVDIVRDGQAIQLVLPSGELNAELSN